MMWTSDHQAVEVGGTTLPRMVASTERELVGQLTDSGASVLVTVPALVPAARSAAAAAGVGKVIVIGEAEGATPIAALLAGGAPAPDVALDPDTAVALLPYSSGTTGLPKGVMLTHTNLVTTVRQMRTGLRLTSRDTMLAVAPFFHIMGFMATLALPLAAGATVVTMPRFDLEGFLTWSGGTGSRSWRCRHRSCGRSPATRRSTPTTCRRWS